MVKQINEQQQRFVAHFTSDPGAIGNASESARRAGYSEKSAAELGRQLLEKGHVQDAIREANLKQISGQIATKAVALLERVIGDETILMKIRVDAAKTILDRAGYAATPNALEPSWKHKHPSEMSEAELQEVMHAALAMMHARDGRTPALIEVLPEPETIPQSSYRQAVTVASNRPLAAQEIAR